MTNDLPLDADAIRRSDDSAATVGDIAPARASNATQTRVIPSPPGPTALDVGPAGAAKAIVASSKTGSGKTVAPLTKKPATPRRASKPAPSTTPLTAANHPRRLEFTTEPAAPFPTAALGKQAAAVANAIERIVQAPPALVGTSVLALLALLAQGHVSVMQIHGSECPTVLFMMTVGESGLRKTTCDRNSTRGVDLAEKVLRAEYRDKLKGSTDMSQPPLAPELKVSTGTVEGILKKLKRGRGTLGLFNDDAGSFFGGAAMSSENRAKTTAWLSQIWDGSVIAHALAGENEVYLVGKRMSAHLALQPKLFFDLVGDETLFQQGFFARTLVTMPRSNIGYRPHRPPTAADLAIVATFAQRVKHRLLQDLPCDEGTENDLAPRVLSITPEGYSVLESYYNEVEAMQRPFHAYEQMKGAASKLPENATRIAGILAHFDDPDVTAISEDHAKRGVELARHYGEEMRRIVNARSSAKTLADAQRVLEWLLQVWKKNEINFTDFNQYSPIRQAEPLKRLLPILAAHNWLVRIRGTGYAGTGDAWKVVRISGSCP